MAALPACSEGVHLAINSLAMYAAPRVKLLGELRGSLDKPQVVLSPACERLACTM